MKTVILTSSGWLKPIVRNAVVPYLPTHRPLKVGYISTASKAVKDDTYAQRDLSIMKDLGFTVTEIELSVMTPHQLQSILPQQESVYVQGGNGFFLLKHARRTGFLHLAQGLVNAGKLIYIGKSAGSYLACPTIEVHTWHSSKWNRFGITDFSAMHLVPFLIQAHYSVNDNPAIEQGMKQSQYPLRLLTNDQALVIQGDKVTLLGLGEEYHYPFSSNLP